MAKKKQSKKHRFKYTEPTVAAGLELAGGRDRSAETRPGEAVGPRKQVSSASSRGVVAIGARDFSYVGKDVRRIAVFAVCLVALELVLWYLFAHTGIGNSVYSSFSVS